jgi:hypothetical protein
MENSTGLLSTGAAHEEGGATPFTALDFWKTISIKERKEGI